MRCSTLLYSQIFSGKVKNIFSEGRPYLKNKTQLHWWPTVSACLVRTALRYIIFRAIFLGYIDIKQIVQKSRQVTESIFSWQKLTSNQVATCRVDHRGRWGYTNKLCPRQISQCHKEQQTWLPGETQWCPPSKWEWCRPAESCGTSWAPVESLLPAMMIISKIHCLQGQKTYEENTVYLYNNSTIVQWKKQIIRFHSRVVKGLCCVSSSHLVSLPGNGHKGEHTHTHSEEWCEGVDPAIHRSEKPLSVKWVLSWFITQDISECTCPAWRRGRGCSWT